MTQDAADSRCMAMYFVVECLLSRCKEPQLCLKPIQEWGGKGIRTGGGGFQGAGLEVRPWE